ncbi:aminodeoxychorismate synthase component I [Sphingomicrobium marinum]|uniref:aminodeoxychorismate synthase component I n=1 Tax=Sphingomicrobium marinum TaxID=1227950 RepID=UPI00223FC86B|nr:aminodeoxychorismate synthase component I [Sphingomicrobium marinum]
MWMLFDDARAGAQGPFRHYRDPVAMVAAHRPEEVRPALEQLRAGLGRGHHAAGFIAYEAGYALDPALAPHFRSCDGPLLCFGLFKEVQLLDAPERDAVLARQGSASWLPPRPRITKERYAAAVQTVREQLFAGDHYQANLTFGCDVEVAGSMPALYAALRRRGGGAWGGICVHDDGALASFSPEQFFKLASGKLTALPMKGTARRHPDPGADAAEAKALAEDEKQRAENLMIVDLLRNDLARVAETGSVEVPRLFAIEHYPTVHQMVSEVTATLRDGFDAIDVLETIFPCGSVTGAPKIAAMQALRQLEPEPRGAYTGSMGWIDPPNADGSAGDAAFNVLIRTIEIVSGRPQARLGLGSGLVVDSQSDAEWAECLLKGAFVSETARNFDLIETMRYDPSEGIVSLEPHLERMKASASELGFAFDRHAARNELQAATFSQSHAAKVRLLLSPSGALAISVSLIEELGEEPVPVEVKTLGVAKDDFRLRHKTTDRDFYDAPRRASRAADVAFVNEDGHLTETSRANIFVPRGDRLITPPLSAGVFPGVLRQQMIEEGKAEEGVLVAGDLGHGFYIGSSLRGLVKARLA